MTQRYVWKDYLFFWWVRAQLPDLGKRRASLEDTPPLPADHAVDPMRIEFERHLSSGKSVIPALLRVFATPVAARGVFLALMTFLSVGLSPLMKRLIERLTAQQADGTTLGLAFVVAVLPLFRSVVLQNLFLYFDVQIFRRCAGLIGASVAAKMLRLVPEEREKMNTGTLVSLADRDAWRVGFFSLLPDFVTFPLAALAASAWLVHLLGWAFLPAWTILLLYLPLRARLIKRLGSFVDEIWRVNRQRVSAVAEAVNAIASIKLMGIENLFIKRVSEIQGRQAGLNVRRANVQVWSRVLDHALPVVLALVSVPIYALLSPSLNVAVLFAILSGFDALTEAIARFPDLLESWVDSRQAAGRLGEFFARRETTDANDQECGLLGAVELTAAQPAGRPGEYSLTVAPGKLVCIVGGVGCGKSTLLGLVAGQVRVAAGIRRVGGKVAWCPSKPWIINATVRDNLSCAGSMDENHLSEIVNSVSLDQDMVHWEKGMETEIGERGINLSGGQRARLALARAALWDADILVLDDPYSALDSGVAQQVHAQFVKGALATKTRIVATHRLEFAADADQVVVLSEGRVVEWGAPAELLRDPDSRFHFLTKHSQERRANIQGVKLETRKTELQEQLIAGNLHSGQLSSDEDVHVPRSDWSSTWRFCKLMAPGILLLTFFCLVVGRRAATLAGEGWLAYWGSHPGLSVLVGIAVFCSLQVAYILMEQAQLSINLRGGTRAASSLHAQMLSGVLNSPKAFFDTTPSGRIVNRFSNDFSEMENALPLRLGAVFRIAASLVLALFTVSAAAPFVLLFFPLMLWGTWRIYRQAIAPGMRLWQLRALNRSLMISRLTECFEGAAVLRAAKLDSLFLKSFFRRLEGSLRISHATFLVNGWQMTQGFLMGAAFVGGTSLLVVQGALTGLHVGLAAVALNSVLQMTERLGNLAQSLRQAEQLQASLKRVLEYSGLVGEGVGEDAPPENWPKRGALEIVDLKVRYRPELAPVLKGLSLTVQAGEKVGIVGRTGSGKTTLFLALTRMVNLARGSVFLDGVDIAKISPTLLRRAITIIPQDPVLFSGSLRFNLDPEGLHGDGEIRAVLERLFSGLKCDSVISGLDAELGEGGIQLSSGERQLICFARAILRGAPLILLDEATSGIDTVTDARIQEIMRTEFAAATILTIAHRSETLAACTRIVELVNGILVEQGASNLGGLSEHAATTVAAQEQVNMESDFGIIHQWKNGPEMAVAAAASSPPGPEFSPES